MSAPPAEQLKLEPHRIERPFQLAATWFVTLVFLVTALLAGADRIDEPAWVKWFLAVAAVLLIPLAGIAVFLLQTRFRPHMLTDPYYARWLEAQEKRFENFKPVLKVGAGSVVDMDSVQDPSDRRSRIYEKNRGLFLVHTWRPSKIPGQVADVVVQLHQHGEGPLTWGTVSFVAYDLGSRFTQEPVVRENREQDFRLDLSAFAPALCLATVHFTDDHPSLDLHRYLDFD